jgi:Uma2 family endonuclease
MPTKSKNPKLEPPTFQPSDNGDDRYTVKDFYRLVPDGQKADLLDGVIYLASPDSRRSNKLTVFLTSLMDMYASAKRLGEVYASRYAFDLTETYSPEPDVAFVSNKRRSILAEQGGQGAPDIAVEIVSRESRDRDYGTKKQTYEQAGVKEYWIVDPLQRRVEFHRLYRGRYRLVSLEHNRIFRSKALKGFWLDVEWLLSRRLPNDYDCLQTILQGEPTL